MPTYKNTSNDDIDLLYDAAKTQIDFINGILPGDEGMPLADVIVLVDNYLQGQIDRADLLDDIAAQLEWFPAAISDIDTALAAVPNLAIPTGAKLIFTLLLENQKRVLQIERRELKAWKFVITNVEIK